VAILRQRDGQSVGDMFCIKIFKSEYAETNDKSLGVALREVGGDNAIFVTEF
jgi:hypothetical protein